VSEGIEYYVTESDGTPATGKNSVLKLFLESDNEYMVHVDGDDMITPYGRNLYRTTAHTDAPDVICLHHQIGIQSFRSELLDLFRKQVDSNTVAQRFMFIPPIYMPCHPHVLDSRSSIGRYIPKISEADVKFFLEHNPDISEETAWTWTHNKKALEEFYIKYNDRRNSLNRLVFFSRKAAEHMWYDPTLIVGEDLVQYYKLKKLAHEGVIDMLVRNENPKYTYLHIADNYSITRTEKPDWGWQGILIEELNKLDMYPKVFRLPEFVDPHYEVKQK